ncbi:S-adenosyl-L-methionine-dependent methyltransferase [Aspergillus floccosus]
MKDVKRYYTSLETRLGNWLLFNGRAHLGLYPVSTWWPFPIRRALLAMEDHMFQSLNLSSGALVLDAGCGDGQVAIAFAQRGLRVHAVDVLLEQVRRARQNVSRLLDDQGETTVTVRQDDYHRLETVDEGSLDGIYTIETLVHARDLPAVLKEFRRVLKPGGRLALYEYDHWAQTADTMALEQEKVRRYGAIASDSSEGASGLARILADAGFEDVREMDLTLNVRPLLRVLAWILYIPCMIVVALGVEASFINTVAVVVNYCNGWRYLAVTGSKPV